MVDDSFSLDNVLRIIKLVSDVGEKAAGTIEEVEAARLIEKEFRDVGLENVCLDPVPVVCRRYLDCGLEMVEPEHMKIPCVNKGTSISTPQEGLKGELIDAGFGTIRDYERLASEGVELDGKIALIDRSDRLTGWPDIPCRLAEDMGVIAVVFTSFVSEHTAFRKEAFPLAPVPAVSIPYAEAQKVRGVLRKSRVKVKLWNIVETEEDGVSYNVVGEMVGSEYPEETIVICAHYDSWFEGGNDNCSAVALMLEAARLIGNMGKPKRTLRFISFGAEESGSNDFFEWSVGSYEYVKKLGEKIKKIVAIVNLDVPSYGDQIGILATPETINYVKEAVGSLDLDYLTRVHDRPISGTDHWFFVMAGVPAICFGLGSGSYGKIYHTQYDNPLNVSSLLPQYVSEILLKTIKDLGTADILPFDFTPTIERLRNDLCSGKDELEGILNLSNALRKADELKDLAVEFNKVKSNLGSASEKDVRLINSLLLKTYSLLNSKIMGSGGKDNKGGAWIIQEQFEMLVKVKGAIEALRDKKLRHAIEKLSSLRTMSWGLNVNLRTYNQTFELMMNKNRYPATYINVMPELLSLKKKMKNNGDVSSELSSIEKKFEAVLGEVKKSISSIDSAIDESRTNLKRIIS